MDLQLKDHHVLITGGSKGIGLACAAGFLQEGARVSLVSRDPANLDRAQKTLSAQAPAWADRIAVHAANLRQSDEALAALRAAEQQFGPVDVLVNSAGAARRTTPDALDADVTLRMWLEVDIDIAAATAAASGLSTVLRTLWCVASVAAS